MEEGSSFVVKDRRAGSSEENTSDGKMASRETPEGLAEDVASPRAKERSRTEEDIPVDFSSFILSLATSALIHLGEEADPSSGKKSVALPNAKQAIDLITLLKEKTTGNLSKEEEHFISQLLYTLRMKFLALEKKRHS